MEITFFPDRGSNPGRLRDRPTLYRVAIKAGLYRKAVQVCYIPIPGDILPLGIYSFSDNCVREDSLAQWLEHWTLIREDRVRIPRSAGNFFSYALFLYGFHVVRLMSVLN